MRIAMISYHTCPRASAEGKETGGMNVYVLELSLALARLGHHVDIFTRSHETGDPPVIEEAPNVRVMHIPAGPQAALPKKKLTFYISEFADKMLQHIENEKFPYDILHAHYYMSGLVAEKIFAKEKHESLPRTAFVMNFHTLALMKNLVARDTLERESLTRVHAEERLAGTADRIIASSENDKAYTQYLYDVPAGKIDVIYPGIDPTLFAPMDQTVARAHIRADREHKIVLFVGRIEPLKGIDTLLYAMKILKKREPSMQVCLWIVGGDTSEIQSRWPKTLRALAVLRSTLGILEDHVHFVGRQPQTELPYYYNAADVVVMPSHYESFGIAALEAMGCGVPVVTTNVAGIAAHVSHVTSANNPLLLADTILHVLGKSHEPPAPFHLNTWGETAEKLLQVYKSLT